MEEQIIFWSGDGKIIPHLLYAYFASIGIGNYFLDESNKKNTEPVMVKLNKNIVSPINVGYLLDNAKNYILECTRENGESGPILDSLHLKTALFSDKNLKLLPTLKLEFVSDTPDSGFFFFKNGIVKVTADDLQICSYEDQDLFIWEKSIIQIDFHPVDSDSLQKESDFMCFLSDITFVEDSIKAASRFKALTSAIGYLLHRHKDPGTTKSIILMDVYINGQPNGGSGKTLLINSIGKLRNLSIIDGKKYDQREWFALSSVDLTSEVLLFDDAEKNFNFEQIFPLMTTGMFIRRKYKDNVWVNYEKSPKVAITTNYAINGTSNAFRRRMYEFELSATYTADFTPRDRFSRNFFDGWDEDEWNRFYNTMFQCLQVFLKDGLIVPEPISLNLSKLINKTCEEFVEFADATLQVDIQYVKKTLYDKYLSAYPEYKTKLKQRDFTFWLRSWGEYQKYQITESHSGDTRTIKFVGTEPEGNNRVIE